MLIEIKEMSTFEQKTFNSKNERKICFKITAHKDYSVHSGLSETPIFWGPGALIV